MNVLWITNILLPEALSLLSGEGSIKGTGGWLVGAATALSEHPDISLSIASVSKKVKEVTRLQGERITYYILPYGKGNYRINHEYEPLWRTIRDYVKPDVVHLHGTEYTHGLSYLEACGSDNVCVSIQGLVSAYYYYYYYGGLTQSEVLKSLTPASIFRGGIKGGYKDFRKRGESEKEIIRRVSHIIGRTSWDRARTWAINPKAEYHHGGESLRKEFYNGSTWKYDTCKAHSIFLSQAGMPLKGLHQVLKAMPLVLRHFPDTTIRIAGNDISRSKCWKEKIKLSDYGNIVRKLVAKENLDRVITFTGPLDAVGMCDEYLRCNVFICPSSIENSPNSLGEAQLLGVPVLASYVGGVADMMRGDEEHLYRFEETEMLAFKIVDLFALKGNVETSIMQEEARKRHDTASNIQELVDIYKVVGQL